MSEFDSFLASLEKEAGGSGKTPPFVFGQIELCFGYKLYISGMPQSDSFFGFVYGDESSKKAAFETATAKYLELKGAAPDRALQPHICIRVVQVETFNPEALEWTGDRYQTAQMWTTSYKEQVKKPIQALGIAPGYAWVELESVLELDREGNPSTEHRRILVPRRVFETKAECQKAYNAWIASGSPASENDAKPAEAPAVPAGWKPNAFHAFAPTLRAEHAGGKSIETLADEYALDKAFLENFLKTTG